MRAVDLQHLEAGLDRKPRRCGPHADHLANVCDRHFSRRRPPFGVGDRTRRDHRPEVLIRALQRSEPLPWTLRASLAAGMIELHSGHRARLLDEAGDGPQCLNVRLVPQAEVAEAPQPPALDLCQFREDQTRAPGGKRREVSEMEGRRAPFLGAVLRHRRDDDAVGQSDAAKRKRRKEQAHQAASPVTHQFFILKNGRFFYLVVNVLPSNIKSFE